MGAVYSAICDSGKSKNIGKTEESNFEYLVFSGGGVKGVCYAGALDVLEKNSILYDSGGVCKIKGFAGTSFGAMVASLIAVGYTPAELKEKLMKLNFETLLEHKTWHYIDAITIFEHYGLNSGDPIYELFGEMIKEKTGNADYTIKQLFDDKKIKLVIVGTNMNCGKSVYFCPENTTEIYANIPIRLAVRISICVPLLFKPVKYKDDLFLDGGVLDNFPIHVFDGEYPGDVKARLNLCEPNMKVLGFHIVPKDEEVDYEVIKRINIGSFTDYFSSFLNTFSYENDRRLMVPSYWQRTVSIVTPAYPLAQLALTQEQKEELVSMGVKYTESFLKK